MNSPLLWSRYLHNKNHFVQWSLREWWKHIKITFDLAQAIMSYLTFLFFNCELILLWNNKYCNLKSNTVLVFYRLSEVCQIPGLARLLCRQSVAVCGIIAGFTCVYYAGFWLGETSGYTDPYYDWRSSVTNEGFLEVSKILADPKTTNDPMIGWVANRQQVKY